MGQQDLIGCQKYGGQLLDVSSHMVQEYNGMHIQVDMRELSVLLTHHGMHLNYQDIQIQRVKHQHGSNTR